MKSLAMEFRCINASEYHALSVSNTILSCFFEEIKIISLAIRHCLVYCGPPHRYTNTNSIASHDDSEKGGGCVPKDNSIEQIIGRRIQLIRKSRGYTQQQFSEMVGLSTNYLSDVERGKSSVRLDKLVTIINMLECSADDVFADVIKSGYKIRSSRLTERIEALPPNEQERVFAVLDTLIGQSEK